MAFVLAARYPAGAVSGHAVESLGVLQPIEKPFVPVIPGEQELDAAAPGLLLESALGQKPVVFDSQRVQVRVAGAVQKERARQEDAMSPQQAANQYSHGDSASLRPHPQQLGANVLGQGSQPSPNPGPRDEE